MSRHVDPTEQLVTEIMVRDIKRSTAFHRRLGFTLLRDGGGFVELTWEKQRGGAGYDLALTHWLLNCLLDSDVW